MKVITLFVALTTFAGCSASGPAYQPHDEEFCSQIHRDNSTTLAEQLVPIEDRMARQTGVYSLEEGDTAMVARAWLSEYAEQSIDVQYFIFSSDNVGLIAVDYLLRAADRGVKVRLLIDDLLVDADAQDIIELDFHENIEVKIYNPNINIGKNLFSKIKNVITDFRGINQRMHNKTFIVDDRVVITGGRNIADEYFDYNQEYNFRDRDVLLLGVGADDIKKSFNQYWSDSLSRPVSELIETKDFKLDPQKTFEWIHQYACNPENFWPQVREKIKQVPRAFDTIINTGGLHWVDRLEYVSDEPGKNEQTSGLSGGGHSTDALIRLIRSAERSITIQSPYLVTTELAQGVFKEAIERGVSIRILTNSLSSTDNLAAFGGYQRSRETLLKSGVSIYEYRPNAAFRIKIMTSTLQQKLDYRPIFGLHAKSMVVDGEVAVVGTFNLDPRSANLNTESLVIIHSADFATQMETVMEEELLPENAWHTTLDFNPDAEAGWWKRLKTWFFQLAPKSTL